MLHICNDCFYKDTCPYCDKKLKYGEGATCSNLLYKKEQEELFTKEMIKYLDSLK